MSIHEPAASLSPPTPSVQQRLIDLPAVAVRLGCRSVTCDASLLSVGSPTSNGVTCCASILLISMPGSTSAATGPAQPERPDIVNPAPVVPRRSREPSPTSRPLNRFLGGTPDGEPSFVRARPQAPLWALASQLHQRAHRPPGPRTGHFRHQDRRQPRRRRWHCTREGVRE